MAITLLLDGRTGVSSKQLVANTLKAALLAHEQANTIQFEINEETKPHLRGSRSLVVVPTGKTGDWPHATLESRLLLDRRATVADIVFDWLGEDSGNPWDRAAEQCKIMLVLRGVARVQSRWRGRTYVLAADAGPLMSQTSPQPVEALLEDCRANQPQVWALFDQEIDRAIRRRTRRSSHEGGSRASDDPWQSEAAADRERFGAQAQVVRLTNIWGVVFIPIGVGLAFLAGWVAIQNQLIGFTAVTAAVITLVWVFLMLPWQASRNIARRCSSWISDQMRARHVSVGSVPEPASVTVADSLVGLVVLVPLLTLFVLIVAVMIKPRPILLLIPVGAVIYGSYRLLQQRVAARINARVMGGRGQRDPRQNAESVPVPGALMTAPASREPGVEVALAPAAPRPTAAEAPVRHVVRDGEARSDSHPMPISLETVSPDDLPPVTDESRRRVAAIWLRAPAIRGTYRKGVAFLALATTLLAVIYWLTGPTPLVFNAGSALRVRFSARMPWFVVTSFLVTLLLLSRRAAPWLRGLGIALILAFTLGGTMSIAPRESDETMASIRPIALRLLGAYWMLVALLRGSIYYSSLTPPQPLLFISISFAIAFGYLYWIHRSAAAVERLYPYQPPLNLLALRVFGSPYLADFLNLSNAWQWIGTRQRLDGPDTAGHKARDLLNYFEGRIDKSIVESEEELQKALDLFEMRPDRQLRCPVNSMQCDNATWKQALQALLDRADVVVMDLSSLSDRNRGVAYELDKLVNEVPLNRLVLLFNDSTDLNVLKEILSQARENMTDDSPNRQPAALRLRVFNMGGSTARSPDESAYDWKRRLRTRMDERALVGLLCDAAQPPRTAMSIDPKRDRNSIHWSRVTMPRLARWTLSFMWWTLITSIVMVSSCRVVQHR